MRRLRGIGLPGAIVIAVVGFFAWEIHDKGWTLFFTLLVNGLTLGSVYALIALGYSMVYGILKLLNFAHGDVYMIGAFIGFGVLSALGGALARPQRLAADRADVRRLRCSAPAVLGVVIERFAYRPPARRAANRAADQRARRLVPAPEQRADPVRRRITATTTRSTSSGTFRRHPHRRRLHLEDPDPRHRRRGRADDRAHAVRRAHAARQGDARDVVRPRGGGDDGNRRRPGDRLRRSSSARRSRERPA